MTLLQDFQAFFKLRVLQLLAFAGLLVAIGTLCFTTKFSVLDPDIWWHLKVGDWIIEHGAFPHSGIFSRTAATRPWAAYSWGYEVLLSRAYAWFGLMGLALFGVLLTLAVACVFFWMVHRLTGGFWPTWLLTVIGCLAFLFTLRPRPVFFSMALFAITLTLTLEAHRSGRLQLLYWLPLVFVLWANLHIQFIYGLVLVGAFVSVNLLQHLGRRLRISPPAWVEHSLPTPALVGIFAACVLVCGVGPYSFHLFAVVSAYARSAFPYAFIQELRAPDFNHFTDYILLLLTAAGFFAVGWQKKLDLFKVSMLLIATVCAFRAARDAWFVAVCATAFIADAFPRKQAHKSVAKISEVAGLTVVVTVFLFLVARNTGFTNRELDRSISRQFPVDAVNYLRRNPVRGPLYNHFDWGGFLIWYMPQYPVAIDGRTDLYGDELDLLTLRSVQGDYASDPYLQEAGLVLLPKKLPLAARLTDDPRFRVIYQDQLSVAFARDWSTRPGFVP